MEDNSANKIENIETNSENQEDKKDKDEMKNNEQKLSKYEGTAIVLIVATVLGFVFSFLVYPFAVFVAFAVLILDIVFLVKSVKLTKTIKSNENVSETTLKKANRLKIGYIIPLAIIFVIFCIGFTPSSQTVENTPQTSSNSVSSKSTSRSSSAPISSVAPEPSMTTGQSQALKSAKSYIKSSAFSYSGLVKQLEFEKFSHEEAIYGADNCGANWDEQAVKMAKQYLKSSSFSKDGLIHQLEYEGFSTEQATNAVNQVYE